MKKVIALVLIFAIVILLLIFGFFSPYNYFTAKYDLRKNEFKKICVNEYIGHFNIEKRVGSKYGITAIDISNVYQMNPINYSGIKTYNYIMKKAFIRIHGEFLYKKYINELDSLQSKVFGR